MGTVNTEYKLKLSGGGNMVDCKPVFPNDPWWYDFQRVRLVLRSD